MKINSFLTAVVLVSAGLTRASFCAEPPPNILLIYADDLGYGDLGCYNDQAKVATPHIDRLAQDGLKFLDAHSPSTVCTPSRYGLLTGRMPFRLNYRGVFVGVQGPCLIAEDRLTLPQMLREKGYSTAMVGKWHLGLTFLDRAGHPVQQASKQRGVELVKQVDFSRRIPDGPLDRGFDSFFGTACCPTTDWLYAWIEGDRIPTPPTQVRDRAKLPDHPYTSDCRAGLIADDFDLQTVDEVFLQRSLRFLEEHHRTEPNRPFFLYHATQAVHLPSLPHPKYQGTSGAGPHGDFIAQLDDTVGQLLAALERLNLAHNTLVVFASDNGPEVLTAVRMRNDHQHDGARPWRGVKRDQWEGGHRVPLIMRWPARIKSDGTSRETVCQTDLFRTCAQIIQYAVPSDAAEDSFSLVPILFGKDLRNSVRPYTLHQTMSLKLAIRQGPWKLLDHQGSGGNNYRRGPLRQYALPETSPNSPGQLYNLDVDPRETTNLYEERSELVDRLRSTLLQSISAGSSRLQSP